MTRDHRTLIIDNQSSTKSLKRTVLAKPRRETSAESQLFTSLRPPGGYRKCLRESHYSLPFLFPARTRIVFGPGAIEQLGDLVREYRGTRVLLVTDPGIVAAGHVERAEKSLAAAGVCVTRFDQVVENPTIEIVDACVAAARQGQIDFFVGLGGGSSMDAAKGCNFVLTNGGRMEDYWGVGKASRPMLPMIAIPTTAGTGSECQSFALITHPQTHVKMACGDPKAAARVAILDPLLTITQPASVAAATGMDALSHAIETAVTRRRNPISQMLSREAFRLCVRGLKCVFEDPQDVKCPGRRAPRRGPGRHGHRE